MGSAQRVYKTSSAFYIGFGVLAVKKAGIYKIDVPFLATPWL
jgi:hypothetical protein